MYALLALALSAPAIPAADAPYMQRDQQRAWEARKEGRVLPLPEIERRVLPQMGGARYLGPEIGDGYIYTLKFLRNDNTVIWVKVDGRTGQIINRTG